MCAATSAKSAGFGSLIKNFFSDDDATGSQQATQGSKASQTNIDDRTCVYKWSSLSCQPEDKCSIQYQFGDVKPSQACRVSDTGDHTKTPQQFHLAYAGEEAGTGMAIS
ncbi:unnamed protein product [Phytophthora lilii]|uniref:Unnamed protein product n=1 Tax=Phytophthora lilii TaxID=2077276 RepID=A0A9W6WRV8_9STRA|nr:unnamed protein product [Phytophthora lilii]